MLLFGGYSTAALADELSVFHEWLELFQIKMTRATSHRTHFLVVTGTSIGFCHLQTLSSLFEFTSAMRSNPYASILSKTDSPSKDGIGKYVAPFAM